MTHTRLLSYDIAPDQYTGHAQAGSRRDPCLGLGAGEGRGRGSDAWLGVALGHEVATTMGEAE